MVRQQVIHGLDRLASEGDLGIDNRIDQQRPSVEPAAELLLAPRLPEGISCDHIKDTRESTNTIRVDLRRG
jgi:hypothetical protein